jgi:uncharacterized protein (UPF0548 family)
MLTISQPSADRLAALVERARSKDMSYQPGLLQRVDAERSWFVDRYSEVVGHGAADFGAACDALRAWAKFRQPWTVPALPLAPIERGATVGYAAKVLGVWWSYCCRIVAVIDERGADGSASFGLDYGTVRGHAERGEERFLVTLDGDGGEVRFSLFAMSRPGTWYTWLGLPIARRAQAKFRPGAAAAVRRWVDEHRSVGVG